MKHEKEEYFVVVFSLGVLSRCLISIYSGIFARFLIHHNAGMRGTCRHLGHVGRNREASSASTR